MKVPATLLAIVISISTYAQEAFKSKIIIDPHIIDTFIFVKEWEYRYYIYLSDSGLVNEKENRLAMPKDTTHYHYTADISTNHVSKILPYGYANRNKDTLHLSFERMAVIDDPNALFPKFDVFIVGDSFFVKCIYLPARISRLQLYNEEIKSQELRLPKRIKRRQKLIYGSLNIVLTQTYTPPVGERQTKEYYFRGSFRVPIPKSNILNTGQCSYIIL